MPCYPASITYVEVNSQNLMTAKINEQANVTDNNEASDTSNVRDRKRESAMTLAGSEDQKLMPSPILDEAQIPKLSTVAGAALQHDIAELNKAFIRVMSTAARLGQSEPLAPLLLDTSPEMVELFMEPRQGERLLSMSLGFPLVKMRIHDVGVMRQLLSDGTVNAQTVQAITKGFPLAILEAVSKRSSG